MTRKKRKTESVGDCLPSLLKTIESRYKDDGHRIWEVWNEAVGNEIARRVQPSRFRNGKLTVSVEGSSWLQQIVFLSPRIIDALNISLGKPLVQSLKVTASEIQAIKPNEPEKSFMRGTPLSAEEEAEIERELAFMNDETLKDAARKARAAAMLRVRKEVGQ